jgi:hypothetical protein
MKLGSSIGSTCQANNSGRVAQSLVQYLPSDVVLIPISDAAP